MRICDLTTSATQLQRAHKHLHDRWAATKELWNDPVSRDFEEKHLQPIFPQIQLTLAAIQKLAEILDDAERDCRDEA
jgi:hypothetical protein